MRARHAAAVLTALVLAAAGRPVLAQDASAMAQTAMALPPGTTELQIDPAAEIIYDSNVADSNAQLAALRDIKPEDEIFSPSLRLDIVLPLGRESVFLVGSAGYDFYRRNSILNRENIDLGAGADGRLGPCQGAVTANLSRFQSALSELNLLPTQKLDQVDLKNVENHETVGANAICGRPVGLAPTVSVREDWNSNSSSLYQIADYRSFTANAGLAYRRPTLGSVSIFGQYVKSDFPEQFLFGLFPIQEGYQLYSGGVQYTKTVGARILGSASVSYSSLQPLSPLSPGFDGVTWIADLTYAATSRLKVHFNFHRSANPSNELGASFMVEREELLEATYTAASRFNLTIGGSQANRRYEGPNLDPVLDVADENDWSAYAKLSFALTRRLSLGLDALEQERRANLTEFSYLDTRVGVSVRAHF